MRLLETLLDAAAAGTVYVLAFNASDSYLLSTCAALGAVAYGLANWFLGNGSR